MQRKMETLMTSPQRYNQARFKQGALRLPNSIPDQFHGWVKSPASEDFARATRAFQRYAHLAVDGKYGPLTERRAREAFDAPIKATRNLHASVWVGWGDLTDDRCKALKDAGCKQLIFNLNSASPDRARSWQWNPDIHQTIKYIETAQRNGVSVGWMPWVWADARFCDEMERGLTWLRGEVGAPDLCELDAEASYEHTARVIEHRQKLSPSEIASRTIDAAQSGVGEGVPFAATVLWWRRRYGSALIRDPRIRRATIQAYTVWLLGESAKAKATQSKAARPGVMQAAAIDNYLRFKFSADLDTLLIGLGWWAQDRPAVHQMTRAEAIRKASDACIREGVDGVSAWALHLWDEPQKPRERGYWELALNEIRYITGHAR